MKLKEIVYLLGLKPKPQTYGYDVITCDSAADGAVEYARWQHPRDQGRALKLEEVSVLRRFLKPGDGAVDIGSHTGDSTIPIALAVGKEGCVLALEPNPYVFPVLEKNSQLNLDKTNIVPLMFAAIPSDGEVVFEYSDSGYCNGGRHEGISRWRHAHAFNLAVNGRNLEKYVRTEQSDLLPRIRFIKVDTEGFDLQVLKSISGIIDEVKPYLKVEVFTRSPRQTREELIRFLRDRGYEVYRVVDESDYFGEKVDATNVMDWRHYDVFCVPGGCS